MLVRTHKTLADLKAELRTELAACIKATKKLGYKCARSRGREIIGTDDAGNRVDDSADWDGTLQDLQLEIVRLEELGATEVVISGGTDGFDAVCHQWDNYDPCVDLFDVVVARKAEDVNGDCTLFRSGSEWTMTGPSGTHTVHELTRNERVEAHWAGFVANN